jgi:hypothetical protein
MACSAHLCRVQLTRQENESSWASFGLNLGLSKCTPYVFCHIVVCLNKKVRLLPKRCMAVAKLCQLAQYPRVAAKLKDYVTISKTIFT